MKEMSKHYLWILAACLLCCTFSRTHAQAEVLVNLAPVDGIDITPDNILNFQIQSNLTKNSNALIKGTIRYRKSDLKISFQFEYMLRPGINIIPADRIRPQYDYSSSALKELFEQHKRLPQGIYEYCVSVKPEYHQSEVTPGPVYDECVYHKSEDIFLINLVDPENNARIYEYNPLLTWTVNYPFVGALTYRIRVAEIKPGQNTVAAITRNNPIYDEKNLMQMSLAYPVYAKALEVNKSYAWTVDAYFRGLLLGGAEPWKFTIVEDSLLTGVPKDPSYVNIRKETGNYSFYAPGLLKIKYDLEDLRTDSLSLQLLDKNNKEVKITPSALQAVYGDNRFIIDFKDTQPLKHLQSYRLLFHSQTGKTYHLLFKYVNPELIK